MANIPIGLQLYSVRKDCDENLAKVMESVAKMGYDGVELYGYAGGSFIGHSAADVKKMLDDNGLKCCGTHLGLPSLQGDALPESIEYHKTIGNKFLIVSWLDKEVLHDADKLKGAAGEFNEAAAALAPEGMFTGYHNHHMEFAEINGHVPWDTFFGNTNKEVVVQLDSGNALHGGGDPVDFISRYPGRALSVHLKEYSATNDKALLGEGDVDWEALFTFCEADGGTEWYVVEQESYAFEPMDCVERCLKTLKDMGK